MPRAMLIAGSSGPVPANAAVHELVDDLLPLLRGQPGQVVHLFCLLDVAAPGGKHAQHGPTQPQHADLRVKRRHVHAGELGHALAALERLTDVIKSQAEVAQGADQGEAGYRGGVIAAVPARRPHRRRQDPAVTPEPDRPGRHADPAGGLPDGVQLR